MSIWCFIEGFKNDPDYKNKYDYLTQVMSFNSCYTPYSLLNLKEWFELEFSSNDEECYEYGGRGVYRCGLFFINKNLRHVSCLAGGRFIKIGKITNFISLDGSINPNDLECVSSVEKYNKKQSLILKKRKEIELCRKQINTLYAELNMIQSTKAIDIKY